MHKNVGKVFVDLSTESYPTYAVGKDGFIHLANNGGLEPVGDWIPYDGAFTGPEFFDHVAFMQIHLNW